MRILIHSISFCEYIIQLAAALAKRGNKVLVLIPASLIDSTIGEDIKNLLHPNIRLNAYQAKKNSRLTLTFYLEIFNIISTFQPDIMHIHENGEIESLLIRLRFRKVPLVLSIHDVVSHPGADSDYILRRKIIRKFLRWNAKKLHVHGIKLQEKLFRMNYTLGEKTVIIPHGTLSLFKRWEKNIVIKEPYTCLFFGRMHKYKGLDSLIEIGRTVKERIPQLKIIIAGSGPELTLHKNALTVSGIFEIHDCFVPDNEVCNYFRRASLLLLPYHEASQSGIIHMSLAFGLPAVVNSVGSICETIEDNIEGKLVPCENIQQFAESICLLLGDKGKLDSMSHACYEKGRLLEFDNIAYKFEDMYREAINLN